MYSWLVSYIHLLFLAAQFLKSETAAMLSDQNQNCSFILSIRSRYYLLNEYLFSFVHFAPYFLS